MITSLLFVFFASSQIFASADAENYESPTRDQGANFCFLPPYPKHGQYIVTGYPSAEPGDRYPDAHLTLSCDTGYQIENNNTNIFCVNGRWSTTIPSCVREMRGWCTLTENPSVEYRCEPSGQGSLNGLRECGSSVPSGTVVTPSCKTPSYFSIGALEKMHCIDGIWDKIVFCKPACGVTTQHRQLEGSSINHLELPWHAVIYRQFAEIYQQICGGSLVSSKVIISAAQCFWNVNMLFPANKHLVAVGKLYQSYKDPRDLSSQYSIVADIKISPLFAGGPANYQSDIALVIVETPFLFLRSVRPVCLDFDNSFDGIQLIEGESGKVVRWNNGGEKSQLPQVLEVVDLPYMNGLDCFFVWLGRSLAYLSSDKICMGSNDGKQLCKADSGGGLAFLDPTTQRYYLRGVLSIGVLPCANHNLYTSILKHKDWIKQYL